MPDEEFDEKITKAVKSLDVLKQFADVFGINNQNPHKINVVDSIDDKLVNSIFFIENQIRQFIVPNQSKILNKLNFYQKIKDLIAFIEKDKFVMKVESEGTDASLQSYIHADKIINKLKELI